MPRLHIALQDGFTGEPVSIRLDGVEVYRKPRVSTDLRISRADAVDVEVLSSRATVELEVRAERATIRIDPQETPFLAVSLDPEGHPQFRASAEPLAYL